MRKTWVLLLATALACAAPVWAGTGEGKGAPAGKKKDEAAPAAAAPAKAGKDVEPANAAVAAELAQLQKLIQEQSKQLAAQQKQIEALQHEVGSRAMSSGATAGPTAAETPSSPPATTALSATVPVVAGPPELEAAEAIPTKAASPAPAKASAGTSSSKSAASQAPGKLPEQIELAGGRIKLGFTLFGDWGMYFKTGFGPQFLTQTNQPGPGNDNFNSFDINRTYINFFYTPRSGAYTLRFTPNIYRQIGSAGAVKNSSVSAVGSSVNGNLTLRMKYAYIDFNHPFEGSDTWGKDKITIGQQTNPLIDWEEGFYGYRFTSLVPWNYLSLSSTHAGVSIHGPIESNGKAYLDYAVGVFDSGSFHNQELAAEKQIMARLTAYPMGATSKYGGLGFTGFVDFGYANNAPDMPNHSLYRTAFMAHYWSKHFALMGEYDYGKNAFGKGNLFSGSGPLDAFGLGTTQFAGLNAAAGQVLVLGAQQRGFDFLGHVDLGNSPFSLFGLFQYFQPNTNISKDPFDFERFLFGIGYKYNGHLRFAIDSQNLIYTQNQFTFNGIPNAVPSNTNALFINAEVNY